MAPKIPIMKWRKKGFSNEPPLGHVGNVVKMPHIVAFHLRLCPRIAERLHEDFQGLKGVGENEVACHFQVLLFPFVLEVLKLIEEGEEAVIERPHVAGR